MANLDRARLLRIVDLIDELRPKDRAANGMFMTYDELQAFEAKHEALITSLIETEGARYRRGNDSTLRMAGITTSCTQGPIGILRNWQRAARRAISELEELETSDPSNLAGSGPTPIVPREG